MRLLSVLPDRWRKLAEEVAKFGTIGLINTVISWGIANILLHTVLPHGELKATLIGTIPATVTAYLLNRFWTYRHRPPKSMRHEYALFFLFNFIGLGIDMGMVYAFRDMLGLTSMLSYNIARVAGLVFGTSFRFWAYRTLVFRPATVPANAVPANPMPVTTVPTAAESVATEMVHLAGRLSSEMSAAAPARRS